MPYTADERKEVYAKVCRGIAAGLSIGKILSADKSLPARDTIFNWLMDDQEFSDQYARARIARADARSERIDDITDEIRAGALDANAARVIIDAEKWQAGKENAKRYGDRLNLDADVGIRATDEQLKSKLAFLLGKAGVGGVVGGSGTPEETA